MKIDLITARGEVNKNGIKYNLSSFDDALKNYINDIPVKYVEFVSDYDSIMSDIRRLTTVKMDEVVGTVESIYEQEKICGPGHHDREMQSRQQPPRGFGPWHEVGPRGQQGVSHGHLRGGNRGREQSVLSQRRDHGLIPP